jgi:hypothetical protein
VAWVALWRAFLAGIFSYKKRASFDITVFSRQVMAILCCVAKKAASEAQTVNRIMRIVSIRIFTM